jgi:4'-phosphopantetheinyl transferase
MNQITQHPLADRNVDVWLAFYDEIDDERLHCEFRDLLTEEERRQEARFHFAEASKRYLVTRAMARTVLSRYAPVAPRAWRFAANRFGRPEILNVECHAKDGERGLAFNISHTRGLVALAVSRDCELGVDVENVVARSVSMKVADRFFAPAEVDELYRVPHDRRQDRFFEYWTLKEAYIKARGMGLSIPLEKFSFYYPQERTVRIAIQPELGDNEGRWCFWQYRPTPEYLLALCAERRGEAAPKVTFRKTIPMRTDDVLELPCLKSSEIWPER